METQKGKMLTQGRTARIRLPQWVEGWLCRQEAVSSRTWNLSAGETEAGGSWGITGVRPASGKGVASKAEDQSLIPGTHVVEGEN